MRTDTNKEVSKCYETRVLDNQIEESFVDLIKDKILINNLFHSM